MSDSHQNYLACRDAVAYVKGKLPLGAGNRPRESPGFGWEAREAINALRTPQGTRFRGPLNESWIRAIAVGAEAAQAGNCGEQSAVAFMYLSQRGIRPIDLMHRTDADHAFVVVGRKAESNAKIPSSWGSSAVVCDAWNASVFAGTEITRRGWQVAPIFQKG